MLPSGLTTTVAGIDTFDGPVDEAFPPMSVTVRLADDVDVSRGDLICRPDQPADRGPGPRRHGGWMTERPVKAGDFLALKHTTRWVRAVVKDVHYRLDVNTLHRDEAATTLGLNDVGRVSLRVTQPLYYDSYRRNRQTGSFILAAEDTNVTVGRRHAARPGLRPGTETMAHSDITWHASQVSRPERAACSARGGAPPSGSPACPVRASPPWPPPSSTGWWRPGGAPIASTATTSAPGSTPTWASDGRAGWRTPDGSPRWPPCSPTPEWWPWSP